MATSCDLPEGVYHSSKTASSYNFCDSVQPFIHRSKIPNCTTCNTLETLFYFYALDAQINNNNKTNDLILNLTPENVTQHSRIVTTTRKGSSTPTKMSKIIGRQIH